MHTCSRINNNQPIRRFERSHCSSAAIAAIAVIRGVRSVRSVRSVAVLQCSTMVPDGDSNNQDVVSDGAGAPSDFLCTGV